MPLGIAAGASALGGVVKLFKSSSASADAKRRAKLNVRPKFDIQDEYFNNVDLASSQAQDGLSESSKNYYQTNAERGLGSSLGALLSTGGGINSIPELYDKFDRNSAAIAAQDSQLKTQNIQNLMQQNNVLADQKTQKWVLNKYQPFLDEAKSIAGQKQEAASLFNGGLNDVTGAITAFATSRKAKDPSDTPYGTPDASSVIEPTRDPALPNSMPETLNDSLGTIPDLHKQARVNAMGAVLNKYKNSPYYDILQSSLAA